MQMYKNGNNSADINAANNSSMLKNMMMLSLEENKMSTSSFEKQSKVR